jgi:hypothetical protein
MRGVVGDEEDGKGQAVDVAEAFGLQTKAVEGVVEQGLEGGEEVGVDDFMMGVVVVGFEPAEADLEAEAHGLGFLLVNFA